MAEENTFICTFLGDIQSGTAENSTQDVEQSIENHSNEYGTFDSEVNYEGPFKPQKDAGNYGVPTVEYCNATAKSTSEHASAHYDNFIKYHVRGETGTSLLIKYDCGHFAIIGDVPDNAESRLFVGSKMLNCFTGNATCRNSNPAVLKYFRTKEKTKEQSLEWIDDYIDKHPRPPSKEEYNEEEEERILRSYCEIRSQIYQPITREEIYE